MKPTKDMNCVSCKWHADADYLDPCIRMSIDDHCCSHPSALRKPGVCPVTGETGFIAMSGDGEAYITPSPNRPCQEVNILICENGLGSCSYWEQMK